MQPSVNTLYSEVVPNPNGDAPQTMPLFDYAANTPTPELTFTPTRSRASATPRNARATQRAKAREERASSGRKSGLAHMPDTDALYGPLVKAGLARIERRRGKPPRIVFTGE